MVFGQASNPAGLGMFYLYMKTMRERLKLIRKKLGLNQTEFARLIGLRQTALSMIEVGTTTLTNKNIKLICATFNVNEQWFRTGKGAMFESSPYVKELLSIFERLLPDTQDFLMEMARNLLKKQEKANENIATEHEKTP
jgi:transcriptional regulator with XRE-family HTH domain